MKKWGFVFVFALGLTACGGGGSTPATKPADQNGNDLTDYSVCNSGTRSSIEGNWKNSQVQNNATVTMYFQVSSSYTRMTADCSAQNSSVRASILLNSSYTSNTLSILNSGNDTQSVSLGGNDRLTCEVKMNPANLGYTFKGSCLVLTYNGESLTMVPAGF